MYELCVKTHFDAAHRLVGYVGKCNREHGHRWDVEVCLRGRKLDSINMLVDFVEVKSALKKLLDVYLDHWQLNEKLREPNPTAEYLAKWLFVSLDKLHWPKSVKLVWTCVWESPDCCVKYSPTMESTGERDDDD